MVPKRLQRAVLDTYQPGQEITKTPTQLYLLAAHDAILAVAEAEGIDPRGRIPREFIDHYHGTLGRLL